MRYSQPQSGPLTIDRGNALGAKVIECIPLSGTRYSIVGNKSLLYGSGGSVTATAKGKALRSSGTGSCALVPLDLSKYSIITIAFSLYWDAYANDDAFAMEFTANANSTAGSFYVDPNSGANGGRFAIVPNGSGANGSGMLYLRPTAATLHRYCITIDIRTQLTTLVVDGVTTTGISAGAPNTVGTTFANSVLYLFSRAGTGLFGTGTMQDLTIYAGALSAIEVAQDYANPWQIYSSPTRRYLVASAAPASVTAALAWTEANDTMSIAGLLTNRASAAWSDADDTMTAAATVTDRAALAWSEQGETASLTVTVQEPAQSSITATIAWTEASETATTVVRLTNRTAIAIVEQDDTWLLEVVADLLETPAAAASAVNIYTIMRNEPVNVSARLGGAVNLIGNLI